MRALVRQKNGILLSFFLADFVQPCTGHFRGTTVNMFSSDMEYPVSIFVKAFWSWTLSCPRFYNLLLLLFAGVAALFVPVGVSGKSTLTKSS